jgi:glycosyltransferase involved in cell wall biosynthesis
MIASAVPNFLAKTAARLEGKTIKKHVDAVITVSQPILDKLGKLSPLNNALVMNCKDLREYDIPEEKVVDLRNKFIQKLAKKRGGAPGTDDKFILLYIGSLGKHRGLMEVLEVFNTLQKEEKLSLIIGGHGSIEEELKEIVESIENVQFIGEVPNEKVPLHTKASDAVFMMIDPNIESHKSAMPNKLFEAMAAGKPIIASVNMLYGELIDRENCGIVIPYGNIKALRNAIMELASDAELRNRLGKSARVAAEREYNWKKQGEKLIKLYNNLTKDMKGKD